MTEMKAHHDRTKNTIKQLKTDIESRKKSLDQLFVYCTQNKDKLKAFQPNIESERSKSASMRKSLRFKRSNALNNILRANSSIGTMVTSKVVDVATDTVKGEGELNVRTKEDSKNSDITGILQWTPDVLVMADWGNDAVKVVNTNTGKVTSQLDFPSKPFDVTVLDNSREIAVSLPYKQQIKILSLATGSLKEVRVIQVSRSCYGLSYHSGKLAVVYKEPDRVEVMDTSGVVTHVIQDERIDGQRGYVCFAGIGNELYVTCKNNTVCKFSVDGECLVTYNDTDLDGIRAMTVTRDGKLLVCGLDSDNIHVVSQGNRKLRVLLSKEDSLWCPQSLFLNEDTGTLYVGNEWSDTIQMYKIK